MSDSEFELTPPELRQAAEEATGNLIPEKSRDRYEKAYNAFTQWTSSHKTTSNSENVVLAYFNELTRTKKPSTCWATYSMLKSTLKIKAKVDISKYPRLQAFLKKNSTGYKPKKSCVLSAENVDDFLNKAAEEFLAVKVALIFGVSGACRSDELFKMRVKDIDFSAERVSILIPNSKTYQARSFVITKPEWVDIVRQYMQLRIKVELDSDRFLLQYRYGKVTKQPFGHNSISKFPEKIAKFLNLPEPSRYTGHCFRRSSATLLANKGCDVMQLKRLGGWRSSAVAESYVDSSVQGQVQIADLLTVPNNPRHNPTASTSKPCTISRPPCSSSPIHSPPPPPQQRACITTSSTTTREFNFSNEEIKQGLHFSINSHDQSVVTINFNNLSSPYYPNPNAETNNDNNN